MELSSHFERVISQSVKSPACLAQQIMSKLHLYASLPILVVKQDKHTARTQKNCGVVLIELVDKEVGKQSQDFQGQKLGNFLDLGFLERYSAKA